MLTKVFTLQGTPHRSSTTPPWIRTAAAADVERLTFYFQPTPQLDQVVAASRLSRCVAILGDAGTGKSALAAGLSRPEVTGGVVPDDFVQAVVFVSERTTSGEVALLMADQLRNSVPQFSTAYKQYRRHTTQKDLAAQDALQREVIGPLHWLVNDRPVRIVVDGLDRLSSSEAPSVVSALDELITDPRLALIYAVVTSRPDTVLPAATRRVTIGGTDDHQIAAYLVRRGVLPHFSDPIVGRARGNWLVARLLADLVLANPDVDAKQLPPDLVAMYDKRIRDAGGADLQRWRTQLRPVLSVLAAAGVGPILPLPILAAASGTLGGPLHRARLHDVLVDLKGVVVRREPGTDSEHVGVFHQTFAEYLLEPAASSFGTHPEEPHSALVAAIDKLAPMEHHDANDPLHAYAKDREADHLWSMGAYERVSESLSRRTSPVPAENLRRWEHWCMRIRELFGPNDLHTINARQNAAYWLGKAGKPAEALGLLRELLPEYTRVLGADHRDTLATRHVMSVYAGEAGNYQEALRLTQSLLPDQERALGPEHRDTLMTRNSVAAWIAHTGNFAEALPRFRELLAIRTRLLGPLHADTLNTQHNIGVTTLDLGDFEGALRLLEELLPVRQRVLGPDHPSTLGTRQGVAFATLKLGDGRRALHLFEELQKDELRVLGAEHPTSLTTRGNIAYAFGSVSGDPEETLRRFRELLADEVRVLGLDHPLTLTTRRNVANWTGEAGNGETALVLFRELLNDQIRVMGADHPDTLGTRHHIALWTARVGNVQEGLRFFRELLPARERVLGPEHPDTITTRDQIHKWKDRGR